MSDVPLPPELLAAILSRLPVDSLLRFRCVSKPWRALIDSKYFINLHLNQSIKDYSHLNLTFSTADALYYLDLSSPTEIVKKIHHPVGFVEELTTVLGSCNGIVCLTSMAPKKYHVEMALLNPSTRKCKIVSMKPPQFSIGSIRRSCVDCFGYDHVHDDYKLVRLVQCCSRDLSLEVSKIDVYSLNSGQWQEFGFPFYNCTRIHSVFANGAIHWWVSYKPEPQTELLIGAFDLTTEKYHLVPQPEFPHKEVVVSLAALAGCLCLIFYAKESVDVWVMKSYRVKDSWSKFISIVDVMVVAKGLEIAPILYSKSGRKVLFQLDGKGLIWYDLEKKEVKNFLVAGAPELSFADVFLGSLVQVKTGAAGGASGSVARKEPSNEKAKNAKRRDDFLSTGFKLVL